MSELLVLAGSERYEARTDEGGISADDPAAVDKLKAKLASLEAVQEKMKAVNAYHRKHKTLGGCPQLTQDEIETLNASMVRDWCSEPKPYESYLLTNNNTSIRQVKARIEALTRQEETVYEGWRFDGGEVKMDREINRLQVFFDAKPDRETCAAMRHSGFKWAPSVGAWQRQLNDNAIYAAKHLDCLQPLSVERVKSVQGPAHDAVAEWRFYIIADLKTWADNAENRSPLEHFDSFEAAKARFEELRDQGYNSETVEPGPDGLPPARLTLELESADGMSAADILHVRQGLNYLVTDFVRMERLRDNPQVMDALARASREIGFDLVRVHEQTNEKTWASTVVSFAEWDNPYFPAATPGSIAARYHDLLRQCYPFSGEDTLRKAQVEEVTRYILDDGRPGVIQLSLVIDGVAASCPNNADAQKLATKLVRDLVQYSASKREPAPKQKAKHEKPRER